MTISLPRILRSTLLLLQGLLLLGCSRPSQPLQPVPGTAVSLAPPSGFSPAPNFAGFVSEDGRASILVAELPAQASHDVGRLFIDEETARRKFATQGVQVQRMDSLSVEDRPVPIAIGTQDGHGHTFNKWIAFFSGSPTVLITLQVPTDHPLTHKAAMKMLVSVRVSPPPSLNEKLAALPFTVAPEKPFRIIDTLAGSSVIMTAGGLDVDPEGRQPMMVVASQLSLPFDSEDLAEVSDQLIAGTRKIQDGNVESRREVMFAGVVGHRVSGRLPDGGTYHHYLALWPGTRFVRMVAILPVGSGQELQHSVEATAASIGFRE